MLAIALISGGLDSILAAKLVQQQGIEVLGLKCKLPFFSSKKNFSFSGLGIDIEEVDISGDFLSILQHPRFGFGSQMNPCIDCRILMLKQAKAMMVKKKAAFVITGEVLGQRPFSQRKKILELVERESGLEGLLLRPLSARLLAKTIPEEKGWLRREELLDIQGRGRRRQLDLARRFGIKDYLEPAGGCLLTEKEFSKRLKDLLAHQRLNLKDIELLKVGRHFRISRRAKLIVGRTEEENKILQELAEDSDLLFYPEQKIAGPTAILRGSIDQDEVSLACSLVCRYCELKEEKAKIFYRQKNACRERQLETVPLAKEALNSLRI